MVYTPSMIERFERIAKALGNDSRLRILALLEDGELCVCQITGVLELAPATVSKHLSLLRGAGLIDSRPDGRWVYYRLAEAKSGSIEKTMVEMIRDQVTGDPVAKADRLKLNDADTDMLEDLYCRGEKACAPLKRRHPAA